VATVKIDPNQWENDPAAAIAEINRVSNMTRLASPFSPQGKLNLYLVSLAAAKEKIFEDTKFLPDNERGQAILKMLDNWHIENPPPESVSKMTEALRKFDIGQIMDSPKAMQEVIDYLRGMKYEDMDEPAMKKSMDVFKAGIEHANRNKKKTNNE